MIMSALHVTAGSLTISFLQCGDASGTGLFDTANRTYDTKRMETIDKSLPDFFPELIGPNEVGLCSPPSFHNAGLSSVQMTYRGRA